MYIYIYTHTHTYTHTYLRFCVSLYVYPEVNKIQILLLQRAATVIPAPHYGSKTLRL